MFIVVTLYETTSPFVAITPHLETARHMVSCVPNKGYIYKQGQEAMPVMIWDGEHFFGEVE